MAEYEGTSIGEKASLHVVLATLGLLVVLGMVGWTVYANNFSPDGMACRDRGGRVTWSGCAVSSAAQSRTVSR
jgi:hypothetical protein